MNDFLVYLENLFSLGHQPIYRQDEIGVFYVYVYESYLPWQGRRAYVGGISQFPNGKNEFLRTVNLHMDLNSLTRWIDSTESENQVHRVSLDIMIEGVSNADLFGVAELLDSMDWWVYDSATNKFLLKELVVKNY